MEKSDYLPLFETRVATWRPLYWLYAVSMVTGIASICAYRWTHISPDTGLRQWALTGISLAELWFIFYWLISQLARCRPIYSRTFKDRLSARYEDALPGVDLFVCTADVEKEPPLMVVNTVLSLMAYDYPPEKLHVYLSDDGGSELMLYALLEASLFSAAWLPFRRKFGIEQPAPTAYFSSPADHGDVTFSQEWKDVKELYDKMNDRINDCMKLGRVPEEFQRRHKVFHEWESGASRSDHQTILEVLIDGRDAKALDVEGKPLPTLVYLAREKRPGCPHNFKAGAMNALIRVSSRISNSPIILNVDCDHYSNNSASVRDAMCFFMDDKQSHNIAYVQYPQYCDNITKNDLYGNYMRVINEVEHPGVAANGGPLYIGSGCFHRRDILCGLKYDKGSSINWRRENMIPITETEETCKMLASCTYEENSLWGKEMGIKYDCAVEDVITGLSIQCRGWRSISFNPKRRGFLGVGPTTLLETLIQHKRWSEGNFQIFLSKYSPLIYGLGKIPLSLQLSYCIYNLWAVNCLATLYYVDATPFFLLKGIRLFPPLSSPWILAYAYVFTAKHTYSLGEFLWCGGTLKGWYNEQRIWLYKRLTSYLYGFNAAIMSRLGLSKFSFVITAKVADDDASERYKKEIMEFGADSSMFVLIAAIAVFNLLAVASVTWNMCNGGWVIGMDSYATEVMLIGMVVVMNLPVLEGMFMRKDKGAIPASVKYKALAVAALAYILAIY